MFLATEPGHDYANLAIKPRSIRKWQDFKNKRHQYEKARAKTVVLDTISGLYRRCKRSVCDEKNVKHPSYAGEFGRTIWDIIGDEFATEFEEWAWGLREDGITLVIIDHTKEESVETNSEEVTKVMCAMQGQARKIVTAMPDFIWFMGYGSPEDTERVDSVDSIHHFRDSRALWLRGGDTVEAGCRDQSMKVKVICPLKEPNIEAKTGGYFQITQEMSGKSTRKKRRTKK